VRRTPFVFCIAALLLTSCGQTPSLWGTYATPTLDARPFILLPADTSTPAPSPSITPPPTSTFTLTPTLIPLESPTPATSLPGTAVTPRLETTTTPTFDVAALLYYAQSGDTVASLAVRFGVDPSEIRSDGPLLQAGLIAPGTLLVIPDRITADTTPNVQIIPDSEMVFSATATNFDITNYIETANGNLNHYREYLGSTGWNSGPDEIKRLAFENSINPRLLLAILDYESRWVHGPPVDSLHIEYPMGYQNFLYRGLFSQIQQECPVWPADRRSQKR
jgi:LysM repeat protein